MHEQNVIRIQPDDGTAADPPGTIGYQQQTLKSVLPAPLRPSVTDSVVTDSVVIVIDSVLKLAGAVE